MDSFEVEKLRKLIENKETFLKKSENFKAAQYLQEEIIFLKDKILPILQYDTVITHNEIGKYAIQCYDELINSGEAERYNGMIIYIHFKDECKAPNLSFVAQYSSINKFKCTLPEIKDTFGIVEKRKI